MPFVGCARVCPQVIGAHIDTDTIRSNSSVSVAASVVESLNFLPLVSSFIPSPRRLALSFRLASGVVGGLPSRVWPKAHVVKALYVGRQCGRGIDNDGVKQLSK